MQSVSYGQDRLRYRVCFNPRRSTRVAIHVHPDGSVWVDAPVGAGLAQIKNAVLRRAQWVFKHVDECSKLKEHVLPREYLSGESHFYLGRRYPLKVVRSGKEGPGTKLVRGQFKVSAPDKSPDKVKALLWHWYVEHAASYFANRLEDLTGKVAWVASAPNWRLRKMKRQWGSCSPKGTLTLNPHLVKAPSRCVEYVLLHELCHLREHNHSRKFYKLLDDHMPDWRSVKARLDGTAEVILND